jgi:putative ubiquitin-RnfH superfamily antitoxin RatB of RatAB toxin-antitoxin module
MNNFHKELLQEIINDWTDNQLDSYIFRQEERLEDVKEVIKDLKEIRRRRNKNKRKPLDTGVRGGS